MITEAHVTEVGNFVFATEASDLGWQGWPAQVATTLGNKLPLFRTSKKVDAEGELLWVTYTQAHGCIRVRVFND